MNESILEDVHCGLSETEGEGKVLQYIKLHNNESSPNFSYSAKNRIKKCLSLCIY